MGPSRRPATVVTLPSLKLVDLVRGGRGALQPGPASPTPHLVLDVRGSHPGALATRITPSYLLRAFTWPPPPNPRSLASSRLSKAPHETPESLGKAGKESQYLKVMGCRNRRDQGKLCRCALWSAAGVLSRPHCWFV